VINAICAHLAEFGIVGIAADANDKRLPEVARACVAALGAQLRMLKERDPTVRSYDQCLAPFQ
jgi:transposase